MSTRDSDADNSASEVDRATMESFVKDPSKREQLVQLLLEEGTTLRGTSSLSPRLTHSGTTQTDNSVATPSGTNMANAMTNATANGGGPPLPWWMTFPPYFPPAATFPFPVASGCSHGDPASLAHAPPAASSSSSNINTTDSSSSTARGHSSGSRKRVSPSDLESLESEEEGDDTQDTISLLQESEALELIEFDPAIQPEDAWSPPDNIVKFLDRHFNKSLSEEERKAILKDFPKPSCDSVQVPKLDDQLKEYLKSKGKDPLYGSEKALYKIQELLLDVSGPLTCLWGDLLNKEVTVSGEMLVRLVQRALVLLGNASHMVSQERRKVAWAKINPKLRSLATEDYSKRGPLLFGPGFLDKASKKVEVDKTMSKMAPPPSKKGKYAQDKSDLRSFLAKGFPARYGNGKPSRPLPYQPPRKFQSRKYFQDNRPSPRDKRNASKPEN